MIDSRVIHCSAQELLTTLINGGGNIPLMFADPPDNLGLDYGDGGASDRRPLDAYYDGLELLMYKALCVSDCFWLSYYWKHDIEIKYRLRTVLQSRPSVSAKTFIWRFTFGQHNSRDYGSGFRFLLRLMKPHAKLNPVRVRSKRQELGDARANPAGRVPDDVWEFPRVVGNSSERRSWHPTQHPEALMSRIIESHTDRDDLVVDLFGGTGTTGRVCKRLSRRYLISEINPSYVKNMREELGGAS